MARCYSPPLSYANLPYNTHSHIIHTLHFSLPKGLLQALTPTTTVIRIVSRAPILYTLTGRIYAVLVLSFIPPHLALLLFFFSIFPFALCLSLWVYLLYFRSLPPSFVVVFLFPRWPLFVSCIARYIWAVLHVLEADNNTNSSNNINTCENNAKLTCLRQKGFTAVLLLLLLLLLLLPIPSIA
jgi:hypothetical protein